MKKDKLEKLSNIDLAMLAIAHEPHTYGIDQDKRPVAVIELDDVKYAVEIMGPDYQQQIARLFRDTYGKILRTSDIKLVQEQLAAEAMLSDRYIEVYRRFALRQDINQLYIDIFDVEGTVLDVHSGKVNITALKQATPNFIANSRMRPLPIYTPGKGDWRLIRKYANLASEDMYPLLMAQLGQMIVRLGPYVMACFVGQAGSGKSEAARFLSWLIDPCDCPLQSFTGNEKDIAISASSSSLLIFDNVEPFTKAESNVLCRLLTAAGLRSRKLFSDNQEIVLKLSSPVIVTSIDQPIRTEDLMDRSITYVFERIAPNQRKAMSQLRAEFEHDKHLIFTALIDMVAFGLNNLENLQLDNLPRMADFARFAGACAGYFDLPPQQMLDLYARSQAVMVVDVADESCFIRAVHRFVTINKDTWKGNITALLKALEFYPEVVQKGWPQSSVSAGKMLTRYSDVLNKLGIDLQRVESHGRKIILSKLPNFQPAELMEVPKVNIRRSALIDKDVA